MLQCQNKCMVSLSIVSYSIVGLLQQDFELRENYTYNKLLEKTPTNYYFRQYNRKLQNKRKHLFYRTSTAVKKKGCHS